MISILNFTKSITNLSWLKCDMHSHILPGLGDDDLKVHQSVKFIRRMSLLGLSEIFATPHINEEKYSTSAFDINLSMARLQMELFTQEVKVNLYASAEYMVNAPFERIYRSEALMTFPNNYLLIEMPLNEESMEIDLHITALQDLGYKVVLAHPEKYLYGEFDIHRFKFYKNMGCYFQMNILSPSGYYGRPIQHAAKSLLREGMVDFLGTDLHNTTELLALEKYVLGGEAYRSFRKNPIRNSELFNTIYA